MSSSFRLPPSLLGDLDKVADARGVPRSFVVREALSAYVERAQPATTGQIIDALVTWKGSGKGNLAEHGEQILRERFRGRRRSR